MHSWPVHVSNIRAQPTQRGGVVVGIHHQPGLDRKDVRVLVRKSVRSALADWLGCDTDRVILENKPGHAVRVHAPAPQVYLSISHADGLSLAALHTCCPVGVDLLKMDTIPDPEECLTLTRDYLGLDKLKQLQSTPTRAQAGHFANWWVEWEACLKCFNEGLTEWTPELHELCRSCDIQHLELPHGYVGALAYRPPLE